MSFIVNFLRFIDMLLTGYTLVVVAAAVISWVNPDPNNPIVRGLRGITEPVFWQIRRRMPSSFGGLDFAPMIVIIAILFLQHVVIRSIIVSLIDTSVVVR